MVFLQPLFRQARFVRKESALLHSNTVLVVIRVDQVACQFQVGASDVVFNAVSQAPGVEQRLALAVVNARPGLAVGIDATLEADFDLCDPPDADLVQALADVRVGWAELADFTDKLLQAACVDLQGYGLAAAGDHERISLTLWNPDLRDSWLAVRRRLRPLARPSNQRIASSNLRRCSSLGFSFQR